MSAVPASRDRGHSLTGVRSVSTWCSRVKRRAGARFESRLQKSATDILSVCREEGLSREGGSALLGQGEVAGGGRSSRRGGHRRDWRKGVGRVSCSLERRVMPAPPELARALVRAERRRPGLVTPTTLTGRRWLAGSGAVGTSPRGARARRGSAGPARSSGCDIPARQRTSEVRTASDRLPQPKGARGQQPTRCTTCVTSCARCSWPKLARLKTLPSWSGPSPARTRRTTEGKSA